MNDTAVNVAELQSLIRLMWRRTPASEPVWGTELPAPRQEILADAGVTDDGLLGMGGILPPPPRVLGYTSARTRCGS